MRFPGSLALLAALAGCARDDWRYRPLDGGAAGSPGDVIDVPAPGDVTGAPETLSPSDIGSSADAPDARGARAVVQAITVRGQTFGLRDDGAVFAAGQNAGAYEGVEGSNRGTLTRVPGLDGAAEISVASITPLVLCARSDAGRVRCKQGAADPVDVTDLDDARQLSGRCALRGDGSVACFSLADYRAEPVALPRDVLRVASFDELHCALRRGGSVWCWGAVGTVLDRPTPSSRTTATPEAVAGVSTATALAVGPSSACAALALGSVVCWGRRSAFALGPDENVGPTAVAGATDVRALTTNSALRGDGRVIVWGGGDRGTRGDGGFANTATAVAVPNVVARRIAEGDARWHVCATRDDGALWCWGDDEYGQLGRGGGIRAYPLPVLARPEVPGDATSLGSVTDVMHSASAACALRGDGTLACWGAEDNGTLGNGVIRRFPPWRVTPATVPGLRDVSSIASWGSTVGATFGARLRDGTLRAWGIGERGAVGDGSLQNRSSPTAVSRITDATLIAVGIQHQCAIRADGSVACWGIGTSGELGDGNTSDASAPVTVAGLTEVVDLALGPDVSVALRRDGSMRLWGNSIGILGGSRVNTAPAPLPPLAEAAQVIAVMPHDWRQVCALQRGGRVRCIGQNLPRTGEWFDMGLADVTQIAGSPASVGCARHADGTVSCWGSNRNGCLGDPSLPQVEGYNAPRQVLLRDGSPLRGVRVVRPGIGKVCAARDDGTLWCWGAGDNGVLGRGMTQWSATPRPAEGAE